MPRVVSYTIQAVTATELKGIAISRQSDGQGGTVLVPEFNSQEGL